MSDEIERLLVRVEANAVAFEGQMKRVNRALYGSSAETRKTLDRIKRDTASAAPQMFKPIGDSFRRELAGMAGPLAAIFSAAEVTKMADEWTDMTGRMRLAVDAGTDVEDAMGRIADMAVRTYSSLENTSEGFFRNAGMMRELGYSTDQTLDYIEALNNALVVSGAKGARAESVISAVSKAMSKGKLEGDNLNTVIESGGRVSELLAEKLGVTTLQLAKLGKDGKITGRVMYDALSGNLEKLRAEAELMPASVADAFQNLRTELVKFIGQTDQSLGASQKLAAAITAVGQNLDLVTKLAGALAAIMGVRFVLAMTAGSGAMLANSLASARLIMFQTAMTASMTGTTRAAVLSTAAMRGFTAALVANPVGAALVGIMAVSAGIMGLASAARKAQDNIETFDAAMAESNRVLAEAREHTDKAAASTKSIGDKSAQAVAGVMGLCDATGKLADETFRLADAQAEAARTAILDRIAKNRVEIADRSAPGLWTRVGEAAGMKYTDGPHKGRYAKDVREEQIKALEQQNAGLMAASIEMGLADGAKWTNRPRATATTTDSDPKKPKKASGPTPAELAAQRQMLDLQAEIELLRAQGQRVAADAKQDQLDTLNLTEQYEKAGFANAKAKAEAHVKALATAREANRVAEEAAELAEGEARAARLTNDFMLDMLDTQEQLALTDRDALDIRRQILAIRQAERRAALEAAAADKDATEAERAAARAALASLPTLEKNENRALDGSSQGAGDAKGIVADLRAPENAVERAREAYAEIDRMRQEDVISEQEAALAKAQIDADLREQRLAGTQTMLGALATLQNSSNKKLAALGKAAAIAQATIDGVLAVQKALASAPPPMNFIQAAVVGAVAAANVASIAGMADGGLVRGPGGPREDKVLRRLSNGEFVVNAKATSQNRALLEAMNNGQRIPGLAGGGLVGRANAAAASLGSARSGSSSSFSYSPTIDARGADGAAVARLERLMAEERRNLPNVIMGVVGKKAKYRLGKNAEA